MTEAEPEFETVAQVGDIPANEGRAYPVKGTMVAIFHVEGEYRAINDFCPHMGASLASGYVEEGCVYCPWHAWKFSLQDGSWTDNPDSSIRAASYEVRVEGTDIQVKVIPPPPLEPPDYG